MTTEATTPAAAPFTRDWSGSYKFEATDFSGPAGHYTTVRASGAEVGITQRRGSCYVALDFTPEYARALAAELIAAADAAETVEARAA